MSQPPRIIPIGPAVAVEPAQHIYARRASGPYTRLRLAFVLLTQLVFYGVPWLMYDGRQAVLFDLAQQRFYLFGTLLLPQDLIYLTGLLIASAMLLFLATVLVGRVWCGFACPQTVYTAMFMGLERRIEGDRSARMRLAQSPWGLNKLLRRGGKYLAWTLLALWTGLSFVGWFTPIRELVQGLPFGMGPWNTFWVLFYAGATYLFSGVLRERMCQHACPYGRFQSAMLDRNTLVVTYDQARGEPRGRHRNAAKEGAAPVGDCVDCTLCVQVCPTGVDIRQGLQSACISCGMCIDACNGVMDKIKAPRGLIRFAPLQAGAQGLAQQLRKPRVWVYGGLILVVLALMSAGLMQRPELRLDAQRDRGVMARLVARGDVENVYRLQIRSASLQTQQLTITVAPGAGQDGQNALRFDIANGQAQPQIEPAGTLNLPIAVRLSAEDAYDRRGQVIPIRFQLTSQDGSHQVQADSTFMVPR